MRMVQLHRGKVKTISIPPPSVTQIYFSNYVTAGDGTSKIEVEGKGQLSQNIAVNVFRLLLREGVPVSYIPVSNFYEQGQHILSRYAIPIPIEVVCQGLATGSYRKRYPEVPEGHEFKELQVEFFLKDDKRHDPKMIMNGGGFDLMRPDLPPQHPEAWMGRFEGYEFDDFWEEGERYEDNRERLERLFGSATDLVVRVYTALRKAFKKLGFTLVDIKIEIGICPITGQVLVIDAITPDEWRLWKDGDRAQAYDKQPFRDSKDKEGDEMKKLIIERYTAIAELTAKF